jgi:hypothetical protein
VCAHFLCFGVETGKDEAHEANIQHLVLCLRIHICRRNERRATSAALMYFEQMYRYAMVAQ